MYSAYMQTADGVWVGTHRLPEPMAIEYCRHFRRASFDCAVAVVPDGQDPMPIFKFVESGFKTLVSWRGHTATLA